MAVSNAGHKFGTFGGVFTPSILTIFGVIMFMRANFVIGESGILLALLILVIAQLITFLTALSISAISSNMEIKGGGAYYMISRVLGPEFGGTVGVALFAASTLSVPFYILGFAEALVLSIPVLEPYFLHITLGTMLTLFLITIIGAGWVIKVQYFIMAILAASIIAFMGGAIVKFDSKQFEKNLKPPGFHSIVGQKWEEEELVALRQRFKNVVEGRISANTYKTKKVALRKVLDKKPNDFLEWVMSSERYSFWLIFAIFFPAVTGILTGINMSGDLKNSSRSITRGTLFAVVVGFVVYLVQILVCGGAFTREALINNPYETLVDASLFSKTIIWTFANGDEIYLGPTLVAAGVIVACLSSALGSLMGAPRVIQAISRDNIIGGIGFFGAGSGVSNEPRRGIVIVGIISAMVLLWAGDESGGASLNVIAGIVTMFFMFTYGTINVAAFLEAFGGNPSFRPRFKYFNWITALLGAAGCAVAALLIDSMMAAVSLIILLALFWHINRKELTADFGDARRGFLFDFVRANLLRLRDMEEDSKNWRPTIIAFSGNPIMRGKLISYASWLEGGKGILFIANIITSKVVDLVKVRLSAEKQLSDHCRNANISAFSMVMFSDDLAIGMRSLFQSAISGPIRPNISMFGWGRSVVRHLDVFKEAAAMNFSIIFMKAGIALKESDNRIDIWWRGRKNGNLMVILTHMMRFNPLWQKAEVRILRVVTNEAGKEPALVALSELLHQARMMATPEVIVSGKSFPEVFEAQSHDATAVFMGMELPEDEQTEEWFTGTNSIVRRTKATVFLISATGKEDMTA